MSAEAQFVSNRITCKAALLSVFGQWMKRADAVRSKSVLFGTNYPFYLGLICVHYNLYKTDKDIPKYIKMHIDDGLELMNKELLDNPNLNGIDYLIDKIDAGLDQFLIYDAR